MIVGLVTTDDTQERSTNIDDLEYLLVRVRKEHPPWPKEELSAWERRTLNLARKLFYGRMEAPKPVIRENRRGYGVESNRHID
jgi:hypothetical protein